MAASLLLVTATLGYQAEAFVRAARELGITLYVASDRCHRLEDPWGDGAVAIRFEDAAAAAEHIAARPWSGSLDAVLALGDRATAAANLAARALALPANSAAAVAACADKFRLRTRLSAAGLPAPRFRRYPLATDPARAAAAAGEAVGYPCVLKPLILSASRGVIRADDPAAFATAFARIGRLLARPEIRAWRQPAGKYIQAESYIPGREFALEGWLRRGRLLALALFDKPDPLEGPFFEETLYVTPSRAASKAQRAVVGAVAAATRAIGLKHGPIHAEVRLTPAGEAVVLEVAARPIGGLCARTLRFVPRDAPEAEPMPLEHLLILAALARDENLAGAYRREPAAAGVMMVPILRAGILGQIEGVEEARATEHVEEVVITARLGHSLEPLPEGATYLGFIFARAGDPAAVEAALRAAHARLRFTFTSTLPVVG